MKRLRMLDGGIAIVLSICLVAGCVPPPADGNGGKTASLTPAGRLADSIMTADELRPGMTGYGLTVFSGVRPERFGVEIIGVLRNYDPSADMILVRCTGHDLEQTGIASGMSGSPVYIKGKLIGAVAYGWDFTIGAVGGVQPIAQMLRNSGMQREVPPAEQELLPEGALAARGGVPGMAASARPGPARTPGHHLLRPAGGFEPGPEARPASGLREAPRLKPLATPLMVSGASARAMKLLEGRLAGSGFVAVRSGGASSADPRLKEAKLEPGGTITIPLLRGDLDISALGTVTAVVGDRVLAFGHPMFAEGPINLPMATGIVHTFLPSLSSSFKLGSAGRVVGAVRRDESYSICGVTGQVPYMAPMRVKVKAWTGAERTFNYQVVDEWYFSSSMAAAAAVYSMSADTASPRELTVKYSGSVRFKSFEPYAFQGVASGFWADYDLADRIAAPIDAMLNNRWGKAVVESIDLEIETINEEQLAILDRARLDNDHLRPGEEVVVHLKLMRYRKKELEKTIRVRLPEDLDDGIYELTLADGDAYSHLMQSLDPRTYNPQNMTELLAAFREMAKPQNDRFYAMLKLPGGGIETKSRHRLPELPASRAMMMAQSGRFEVFSFARARTWEFPMDGPVSGSRSFQIRVDRDKGKRF